MAVIDDYKNTAETSALLLWILILGGAAVAGNSQDRAWFVVRVTKIVMGLKISSWEEAKLLLMRFFWVDSIHEGTCRDLWDETWINITVNARNG